LNNAIPVSLWFVLAAFGWLPGANLTIASVLTLVLTVFGFAFVWGILGGSMPRSGGSYVYNSRIIHPAVGLGVSITNGGFVMLAWIWVLAPWIGEYGLPIMVGSLGYDVSTVAWATSGWGLYLLTTIVNIGAFLVVMAGMKFYFKLQKVLISWSIVGAIIAGIIISVTSYDKFVEIWNNYAAQYNSLDFQATIAAASDAIGGIPETWNWPSTLGLMLPISWIAVYGYIITFIRRGSQKSAEEYFHGTDTECRCMHCFSALGRPSLHENAWLGRFACLGVYKRGIARGREFTVYTDLYRHSLFDCRIQ